MWQIQSIPTAELFDSLVRAIPVLSQGAGFEWSWAEDPPQWRIEGRDTPSGEWTEFDTIAGTERSLALGAFSNVFARVVGVELDGTTWATPPSNTILVH